jgi:hypothetical protein
LHTRRRVYKLTPALFSFPFDRGSPELKRPCRRT